ncbi:MAG: hypothetical protein QME85_02095 [Candidatus Saccharicenans sp.]|nr:hypothetical protein [Candidatus Saccharicenans sp.]MDI6849322.1 hypothetical protein [Candidatus Saccharicenans sp.]
MSPGLEVSYSPVFEHPELKFVVNEKEAIYHEGGGGSGGGYYDRSFYVYAGKSGEKNLEVILMSKNEKLRRLWQVKIF